MKNLFKISLAVVMSMFVLSCTTDMTEDVNVNIAGQTTLTLSLGEATKTYLGDKSGESYPLYWSEGDQISVNGVVSEALKSVPTGATNAEFAFSGALNAPYSVVYPANADGANEVTFLANQTYTAGTFCNGAAPMYGYTESSELAVQMHHLAGVIQLAVSGEATLSKVVLIAEKGNLAGTYTVDCATGALTEKVGTTSTMTTLTFGEGLALGAEATPLYIAVPAGDFGVVSALLYSTTDEVMTVKFNTTSKPVSAGKVREFAPFVYAGTVDTSDYVIDSKEALIRFAANPTRSATVVADIDMTGYNWTSVKDFAHTFDGGNFEIKGLNAPLFYSTESAILKNIKLSNVNILVNQLYVQEDSHRALAGALARYIVGGEVSNCSASGEMEINLAFKNADTDLSATSEYAVGVGGIAGIIKDATTVTKLTNRVNIKITSLLGAAGESKFHNNIGGITGHLPGLTLLEECYNYGNISYIPNHTSTTIRCGGIVGYATSVGTYNKVENHGDISLNLITTGTYYVGGVVGLPYSTTDLKFESCKNSGAITVGSAVSADGMYVGHIAGYQNGHNVTFSNCEASGDITLACDCANLYTGLMGRFYASTSTLFSHTIENCTTSANLTTTPDFSATGSSYPTLGFADTRSSAYSCLTMKNYNVSGNIKVEGSFASFTYISGFVGYWRCKTNSKYKLLMENCTYSGDIYINATFENRPTVGGCLAYNSGNYATMTNVKNTGNITFHSTIDNEKDIKTWVAIGGVVGYNGQEINMTGCSNSGDITVSGNLKSRVYNAATETEPASWGDITTLRVGGCIGSYVPNEDNRYNTKNLINTGNVTLGKEGVTTEINGLELGGVIGRLGAYYISALYNEGDITVVNVVDHDKANTKIGGVIGSLPSTLSNAKSVCTISAVGYTGQVGMAMGIPYAEATKVTNGQFGGKMIVKTIWEESEDAHVPVEEEVTASNFHQFIYSNAVYTADQAATDTCTYLAPTK